MNVIFSPEKYNPGTFLNLKDALSTIYPQFRLVNIIRYNKVYRDFLRQYGMDKTIELLTEKVPELSKNPKIFSHLREEFDKTGLADYDIQCLPIDTALRIKGVFFEGLKEIARRVTFSELFPSEISAIDGSTFKRRKEALNGIEITEIYKLYPCFDAEDYASEDRYYRNYFLTDKPIPADYLNRVIKQQKSPDYGLCTETLPPDFLPMIYYQGEGNYMLVATEFNSLIL